MMDNVQKHNIYINVPSSQTFRSYLYSLWFCWHTTKKCFLFCVHCRNQEVLTTILESGAVPYLVDMLTAEHAVMQNEALLALTLLASMRLADAEADLLQAKIGDKLAGLINDFGPSLACEMVQNILSLVNKLANTGNVFGLLYILFIVIILIYAGLRLIYVHYSSRCSWSLSLFASTSDLFGPVIYVLVFTLVSSGLSFCKCFTSSFGGLQIPD
jgi:hypothetical protein